MANFITNNAIFFFSKNFNFCGFFQFDFLISTWSFNIYNQFSYEKYMPHPFEQTLRFVDVFHASRSNKLTYKHKRCTLTHTQTHMWCTRKLLQKESLLIIWIINWLSTGTDKSSIFSVFHFHAHSQAQTDRHKHIHIPKSINTFLRYIFIE